MTKLRKVTCVNPETVRRTFEVTVDNGGVLENDVKIKVKVWWFFNRQITICQGALIWRVENGAAGEHQYRTAGPLLREERWLILAP